MKTVTLAGLIGIAAVFPNFCGAGPSVDWSEVIAKTQKSIVEIEVGFLTADNQKVTEQGTGFAIREDGYILTNRHLLQKKDARTISITVSIGSRDGNRYQMRVVKVDETLDLALLVFANKPTGLSAIKTANSGGLRQGDPVLVVGFPSYENGNDYRPAFGNITSLQADTGNLVAGLESDMTLYPGNSGGPLLNASGGVVGIVVSKLRTNTNGDPENRVAYFLRIEQAAPLVALANTLAATPAQQLNPGSSNQASHAPGPTLRFPSLQKLSLADIPREAFVPLQHASSADELRAQLDSYPSLDLSQDTLTVQDLDSPGQKTITMFMSSLRMDDSTMFVLNRDVVLVVGTLELSRAHLYSFPSGIGPAPAGRDASGVGEPGGNGANGTASGSLTIYALDKKVADVEVNLAGQDGGKGGRGGPGRVGDRGANGEGGSDHLFDCAHGPGDGQRGGAGQPGAAGGRGGDGGGAGRFSIFVLEGAISAQRDIVSSSRGGAGGEGGPGGVGGPGGNGGSRGSQTTYCRGGSDGPPGPEGVPGPRGEDGSKGGDGTLRVEAPFPFDHFPDFGH